MEKVLSKMFYVLLFVSTLMFFLPIRFTMGVYTPNIFGWIWLLGLIPLTIILFIWVSIDNYKKRNWIAIIFQSTLFVSAILAIGILWIYST